MSLKKFRKFLDSVHFDIKGQSTQSSNETLLSQLKFYGIPHDAS